MVFLPLPADRLRAVEKKEVLHNFNKLEWFAGVGKSLEARESRVEEFEKNPEDFAHYCVEISTGCDRCGREWVSTAWSSIPPDMGGYGHFDRDCKGLVASLPKGVGQELRREGICAEVLSRRLSMKRECDCCEDTHDVSMVGCSNDKCEYGEWFHASCQGLSTDEVAEIELRETWYCPGCAGRPAVPLVAKQRAAQQWVQEVADRVAQQKSAVAVTRDSRKAKRKDCTETYAECSEAVKKTAVEGREAAMSSALADMQVDEEDEDFHEEDEGLHEEDEEFLDKSNPPKFRLKFRRATWFDRDGPTGRLVAGPANVMHGYGLRADRETRAKYSLDRECVAYLRTKYYFVRRGHLQFVRPPREAIKARLTEIQSLDSAYKQDSMIAHAVAQDANRKRINAKAKAERHAKKALKRLRGEDEPSTGQSVLVAPAAGPEKGLAKIFSKDQEVQFRSVSPRKGPWEAAAFLGTRGIYVYFTMPGGRIEERIRKKVEVRECQKENTAPLLSGPDHRAQLHAQLGAATAAMDYVTVCNIGQQLLALGPELA